MTFIRSAVVALLLGAPVLAQQQGKDLKPPTDVPPVGKAPILLFEDFETTAPGQVPRGYTKQGAVSVVNDVAQSGRQSLKMEAAVNGPRRITFKSDTLAQLGAGKTFNVTVLRAGKVVELNGKVP